MSTSANRRRARAAITTYNRSDMFKLSDAYKTYSTAKARAWNYCESLMKKYDGFGLRVLTYNTFTFTAGFRFFDAETGETMFMYITPNYDTAVSCPAWLF